MDNDLKLLDVINDPDALDQFLDFSAVGSGAQQNSFEGATGEFYNFENGQILKSSTENAGDIHWSYAPTASVSDAFFDHSLGLSATQITNVPVATVAPKCGAGSQVQNLRTGALAINSTGNYSSQNAVQLQQTRNISDQFSGAIVTDNSLRAPSVNKVVTNFSVASSANNNAVILPNNVGVTLAGNGGQMLMNVQPQTVVQNGAVRIQYVQVRNQQHQPTVTQLPTNSLNSLQLQQQGVQISHGVPGGINLHGARILIQAGNQSVSGNRTGQPMNLQQMQVSSSNLVGITQGAGLQQGNILQQGTVVQQGTILQQGNMLQQGTVLQHGAVLQQGTTMLPSGTGLQHGKQFQQARLPTGTLMGRTNTLPMTAQVVDSNLNLSSGGQMVLQRASGQNVVFQTLQPQQHQQQHGISLPQQQTISSQDGKLPDGLVVQIGGQVYRFEQTHQSTGGVKQGAIYPQSQGGEYGEGGGVAHDPVKMLQQNVQLQQMLIGNQINVLQLLQQQQQRQQQTTGNNQDTLQTSYAPASVSKNFVMVGQQFLGSQASNSGMMVVGPHQTSGGVVVNPIEVTGVSSGLGSMPLRPTFASSPVLRPTLENSSSETHTQILQTVKLGSTSTAATSVPQFGHQFIQPKPTTSVSVFHGVTSGSSNFGSGIPTQPVSNQPPGNSATSVQQQNLRLSSSVSTVQSVAPSLPGTQQALKSGILQGPQNVQPVSSVNQSLTPAGQSQAVTTVQLSADQQSLLTKIQSQMKVLLDLPKRNPDQEKYLQMLIGGQQRIISQGVAQYLQQQKINNTAATSGTTTQSQVTATRPVPSAGKSAEAGNACQANSGESLAAGGISMTSALSSLTSTSSAGGPVSSPSGPQNSGAPVKAEDLFQAFPYLKEKLEAQLAKMPPEQRQWFAKNQSVVFAKLQHHHRLLQERDKLQQQQQQQQQQQPQPLKHLASAQQIATETSGPPPDATATRVIRSLHLTRAQKFHLYLQKDQKRATHPESSKPFENFKDVIRGLVPYHVFQTREPLAKDVAAVEEAFEGKSRELLDRKDCMLRKYRHLLWEEAMRPQLTSEMVLLERAFHSDEKALLLEERRQAEEDPESFVPRPVLKRLKLDDDIKKEEEDECKDEDVTSADDTKMDFESHDKVGFLKAVKTEDSSGHSSPSNTSTSSKSPPPGASFSRSSSIECYKSLQIKLEKLDSTQPDVCKRWHVTNDRSQHSLNLHISARNVTRTDANSDAANPSKTGRVDNGGWLSNADAIEVPTTSSVGLFPSFTEDDAAVASLLNTEQLTTCSFPAGDVKEVPPTRVADVEPTTERNQRFDLDDSVNTLDESVNSDSEDELYADQEMCFDVGRGETAKDEEDDELMQGTIDSLMADLTQFNRDLSSTSWMGSETKSDTLNGSLRRTGNQSTSSKYNSPQPASTSSIHEDSENSSLQHEIQCAINSIIRLQQPWSDNASSMTEIPANIPRSDDDESSLDAAVNSILL